TVFRCLQSSQNLSRMMAVIVNNGDAVDLALELKTAICVSKSGESIGDLGERNIQFERHGDRGESVVNVVFAWYREIYFTQLVRSAPNRKGRTEGVVIPNIVSRDIGLGGQTVRDAATLYMRDDQLDVRIVETNDRGSVKRHLVYEVGKALDDIVHSLIRLHVL